MHRAAYLCDFIRVWLMGGMRLRLEKPRRPIWRYGRKRRVVTPYG